MHYQIVNFFQLIKHSIHLDKESQLNEDIDWEFMVKLAREHNLLPIFMEEAVKYSTYVNRPEYIQEMKDVLSVVAAQTKRTKVFLELYTTFSKVGIYPIVMKGLICRELYSELCDHRPSGDEDILIRKDQYWKAKEVLIKAGYVTKISEETDAQLEQLQEISFVHPIEKLHIELHINPIGKENDSRTRINDYFKNVFEDCREVNISGVTIYTMSHQKHLLFLIMHAFKHFMSGGIGIRPILDILMYQQKNNKEIDLRELQAVLRKFKADKFWSDIIFIGNSYLGFDLPVLQAPNCPWELIEDMVECGAFGNKTQAEMTAARVTMQATGNSLKPHTSSSIRMICKVLFPNKSFLLGQAPYLEEKPWLLPLEWIKRWDRFLRKNRNSDKNLTIESVKISQRRMKLLKKYDLF